MDITIHANNAYVGAPTPAPPPDMLSGEAVDFAPAPRMSAAKPAFRSRTMRVAAVSGAVPAIGLAALAGGDNALAELLADAPSWLYLTCLVGVSAVMAALRTVTQSPLAKRRR